MRKAQSEQEFAGVEGAEDEVRESVRGQITQGFVNLY